MMLGNEIQHKVHVDHVQHENVGDVGDHAHHALLRLPVLCKNGEHVENEEESGEKDGEKAAIEAERKEHLFI